MRSRLRITAAGLLVIAALTAPAGVAADTTGGGSGTDFGTITITIGPAATLKARLIVTVPMTITCTTPADAISVDGTWASVNLIQASGRTVAGGSAAIVAFACDGAPHSYSTTIVATSVPFHGGSARVAVGATVCGQLADFNTACTGVTTPWTAIKIAG
jgi:hypothetical protein